MKPARALGQNFLIVDSIADRQVELADISPGERVLEVGPGKGILTKKLLETGAAVTALELDRSLEPHLAPLEKEFPSLKLVFTDALKWLEVNRGKTDFSKIVANIPYNISTPLLFEFLEHPFSLAVLMVQEEFGRRVCYLPGAPRRDYSRITISIFTRCVAEYAFGVPGECFEPVPEVDSAVITLARRDSPPFMIEDEGLFSLVVKNSFENRRKMLRNSLASLLNDLDADSRDELLDFERKRPEELGPEEFALVSNVIARHRKRRGNAGTTGNSPQGNQR